MNENIDKFGENGKRGNKGSRVPELSPAMITIVHRGEPNSSPLEFDLLAPSFSTQDRILIDIVPTDSADLDISAIMERKNKNHYSIGRIEIVSDSFAQRSQVLFYHQHSFTNDKGEVLMPLQSDSDENKHTVTGFKNIWIGNKQRLFYRLAAGKRVEIYFYPLFSQPLDLKPAANEKTA